MDSPGFTKITDENLKRVCRVRGTVDNSNYYETFISGAIFLAEPLGRREE
jgi:hypothetical protein